MALGEVFIYDEQKFLSQVGLDIVVPWRVVPGDLSFPGLALSCCLLCLWIEFKFEVVATFIKRLFLWGDSFIKDLFIGRNVSKPFINVLRDVFQQCREVVTQPVDITCCLASCTACRFHLKGQR